jgi:membrane-associated phospholipid phosphatase
LDLRLQALLKMLANGEPSCRSPGSAARAVASNPRWFGVVLLCGFAVAVVTVAVMEDLLLALDSAALSTLAAWGSPWVLWSMRSVTTLGGMPWIPALPGFLSLVVWHVHGPRVLLCWAGHTLGSEGIFLAIRVLTHRPRPHSHAVAYPSGHTLAAVCVYGLMIYFLWPGQGWGRWYRRAACGGS